MRPGRQLAVLGLLFAILYALVFFAAVPDKMGMAERLKPRLGLDLIGGTRVTYEASTQTGAAPPQQNLEQARDIIDSRVNALGVAEAEVVIEGNRNIVVSVAGEPEEQLKNVGQPAQLRFRKVLKATNDTGPVQAPPSAAPSGSPAPAPGASAAPGAPAQVGPAPSGGAGGQGGGAPAPSPSTPAAPGASAAPAATPAAPAPAGAGTPPPTQAEVRKIVGEPAWKAAEALKEPSADPAQTQVLEPFGKLNGAQVNALSPEMQFNVPAITCAKLAERPAGAIDDVTKKVVACEGAKYYLDIAKVEGTDVGDANAVIDSQTNEWVVSLEFTGDGQKKWTDLTREAYANTGKTCEQSALSSEGNCLVAVVLDKDVVSAPQIQGVLTGQSQISGSFTNATATELANQLRFGALPLSFKSPNQETVSATLGTTYLRAGLIAMGIGMALVALYAFFYYRLLGSVILLSLVLSAVLVYGAIAFLGRAMGFTLTLAGIAGLIVSLGVAADSFVIYFERLKDEVRDGRSPRSAVPRAWIRARRTIISANAISIMAAVVLYIVSIGTVKGFAFALGLATILDLVVVFLFRHPIMTMFARMPAFLSPRISGLGRAVQETSAKPVTPRAKEA